MKKVSVEQVLKIRRKGSGIKLCTLLPICLEAKIKRERQLRPKKSESPKLEDEKKRRSMKKLKRVRSSQFLEATSQDRAVLRWKQVREIKPILAEAGRQGKEVKEYLSASGISLRAIMRKVAIKHGGAFNPEVKDILQVREKDDEGELLSARGVSHRSRTYFEELIETNTASIQQNTSRLIAHSVEAGNQLYRAYFLRAFAHSRLNNLNAAIDDYSSCIKLEPHRTDAYFNRALILHQAGLVESAIKDLTIAIELEPTRKEFYHNRALLYRQIVGSESFCANSRLQGDCIAAAENYQILRTLESEEKREMKTSRMSLSRSQKHFKEEPQQPTASVLNSDGAHTRDNIRELRRSMSQTHAPKIRSGKPTGPSLHESLRSVKVSHTVPMINASLQHPFFTSAMSPAVAEALAIPLQMSPFDEINSVSLPQPPASPLRNRRKNSVLAMAVAAVGAKPTANIVSNDTNLVIRLLRKREFRVAPEPTLSPAPSDRSYQDFAHISASVGHLSFFRQMPRPILRELCALMLLRTVPHGCYVFRQGDVSDSYFVVLDGVVSIRAVAENGQGEKVLKHLYVGDSFGEMALDLQTEEADLRRSASIYVDESCQLLELKRSDFLTMKSTFLDWLASERLKMLRQSFLLNGVDEALLAELAAVVQTKRFEPGSVIVSESDDTLGLYVVRNGICRICKRLQLLPEQAYQVGVHHYCTTSPEQKKSLLLPDAVQRYGFRGASLNEYEALPASTSCIHARENNEAEAVDETEDQRRASIAKRNRRASTGLLSPLSAKPLEPADPRRRSGPCSPKPPSTWSFNFAAAVNELQKKRRVRRTPVDMTTSIVTVGQWFGGVSVHSPKGVWPVSVLADTKVECLYVSPEHIKTFKEIFKPDGVVGLRIKRALNRVAGKTADGMLRQYLAKRRWEKRRLQVADSVRTEKTKKRIEEVMRRSAVKQRHPESRATGHVYRPRDLTAMAEQLISKRMLTSKKKK